MNFKIPTRYEELMLEVVVETTKPCRVRLVVFDLKHPKTKFTDRPMNIDGRRRLIVRMPLSPKVAGISVFNEDNGNKPEGQDETIKVISINPMPLQKRMDIVDMDKGDIGTFVKFAQQFSFNASYMEAGKTYYNRFGNKRFSIRYMETIPARTNKQTGKTVKTPAQVSMNTGVIEVSKEAFATYTVPMRMVVLLHEFSHFNVNSRIEDEEEADLNALLIYLSLGYPRIEATEAFYKIFLETDTPANLQRWKIIEQFINNFEKTNIIIE
jgi:hypothetical protein